MSHDEASFATLSHFEPLRPALYNAAKHRLTSPDDADDVVQLVYDRIGQALEAHPRLIANPRAYAFEVLRHTVADWTRGGRGTGTPPKVLTTSRDGTKRLSPREVAAGFALYGEAAHDGNGGRAIDNGSAALIRSAAGRHGAAPLWGGRVEEHALACHQVHRIIDLMPLLPKDQYRAIELTAFAGLTNKAAAAAMGISVDRLATHLKAARATLRQLTTPKRPGRRIV